MKLRVFVTGGAHGIGKAIVQSFSKNGHSVYFCDIDREQGEKTARETYSTFYHLDVCDVAALENCMRDIIGREKDIDVIVNNVGIGGFKPLIDLELEEFERVIDTNLRTVFVTGKFLALTRESTGNREYGRIINICSTRYLQSEPGSEAYAASKGGIFSLTHALAASLSHLHITVNAIAPGWIHVKNDEKLRKKDHQFHLSGRVGNADDIARLCLFLSEKENDFINGQTITVDGGTTVKMIYPA